MTLEGLTLIDALAGGFLTLQTIVNAYLAKKVKNVQSDHKSTTEILEIARDLDILLKARDQKFLLLETEAKAVRVLVKELSEKFSTLEEKVDTILLNGNGKPS